MQSPNPPNVTYTPFSDVTECGAFGEVSLHKKTGGQIVALKTQRLDKDAATADDEDDIAMLRISKEVEILRKIHGSGNVVNMQETFSVGSNHVIVTDAYPYRLDRAVQRSILVVDVAVSHLLNALVSIANFKVLHRDIKPENIMIDEKGQLKMIDFGMGFIVDNAEEGANSVDYVTTRWYRPPELLCVRDETFFYTNEIDTWSSGLVIMFMALKRPWITGKTAVETMSQIGQMFSLGASWDRSTLNQIPKIVFPNGTVVPRVAFEMVQPNPNVRKEFDPIQYIDPLMLLQSSISL